MGIATPSAGQLAARLIRSNEAARHPALAGRRRASGGKDQERQQIEQGRWKFDAGVMPAVMENGQALLPPSATKPELGLGQSRRRVCWWNE